MPPPHQPPPPTMTPGPPHCVADALPTTSPIAPSLAATPEAELQTPVSTRRESTRTPRRHCPRGPDAPAPSLNPENELLRPRWPTNPPSASPPPVPPTMHPPPELVPAPPLPPQAAPPSASDAPASPTPLTLAPLPRALKCSSPAPSLPSPLMCSYAA
ncbi:hypothetical protein E4T56_gene4636 [Termitomyces sp. T112]|nr:hypothetical protein E4T56_gene4636 [Termitomyces sp. T112]